MTVQITPREAKRMADTDSHKEWMKKNTVMINARLQRSTDADIIKYLEGRSTQAEIKRGLRLLIEQENKTE